MRLFRFFFAIVVIVVGRSTLHAQNYYGFTNTGTLVIINPQTCEVCQSLVLNGIVPSNLPFNGDILVTNDGNVILTQGNQLLIYEPPNPNPIVNLSGSPLPSVFGGSAVSPSGVIYIAGSVGSTSNLYTFDPGTNTLSLIGSFPAGFPLFQDLFYVNGQLFAMGGAGIFSINPTVPSVSQTPYSISNLPAITDDGIYIIFNVLTQFDPITGQVGGNTCTFPSGTPTVEELYLIPSSVNPQPSCSNNCITNAGTITNTTLNVCVPNSASIPYNNNAVLDPNDILQYAIVTNPANPAGSLLFISNTNPVVFDPNFFTPGVTYYMGTVAGNNVNGSVDANDPCRDFSNMIPVTWRPVPTVTFNSGNPDICAGNCQTVTASFSGMPPFTLQGQVLLNGSPISTLSNTFNATSGTLQVCAPANTTGNLTFQATQLTDANCTCN